ncbi:UDP-glucuronosyltransferase [Aphelenchoides bicaudatus]|nr:UDP-glucuronosyltransferase [Aphelenchoides bicaudatus]
MYRISVGHAFKFLVYNPKLGHSQTIWMNDISDILGKAGHDVLNYAPIVVDVFNSSRPKFARTLIRPATHNSTQTGDIRYDAWVFDHRSYHGAIEMFGGLGYEFEASCKEQLADEKLLDQLRSENFDLGLSEYFDICGLAIFHKIGLKRWILLYSNPMPLGDMHLFGVQATPSFTPSFSVGWSTERMSMKERLFNWFNYFFYRYHLRETFLGQTAKAFPPDIPHYTELMSRSQYIFVNMDEHLDFPRPVSFKHVNVAGVGMQNTVNSSAIEDPHIKKAIETAEDGVVLVSFGSVTSSFGMPDKNKKALLAAFDSFPKLTFLWKYEREDNIADGHPNVVTSKWLDQPKILSHPKLRAFVTHGGLNSVTQSVYAGAPMIVVPLFADQPRNAFMVESRQIGVQLDKFNLNADVLIDAIQKVVYNPVIASNAKELSQTIRSKPMNSEERILKYSEHAAQFDVHKYLDSYGRQLNSVEYHGLDLLALLVSVVLLSVYCAYCLVYKIVHISLSSKQKVQ